MSITLPGAEELALIGTGLNKLLDQGVNVVQKQKIMEIFTNYPSLKEEKFKDPEFQKKVFDEYKKFLKNIYNYDGYIKSYCHDFPFLVQMTLDNEELQKELTKSAEEYISSLARSVEYPDSECTAFLTDRVSGLLGLEKFFDNPIISEEVQQAQVEGLVKAFGPWIAKRRGGVRYERVYALVKKSGATEEEMGEAAYRARNQHNRSNVNVQIGRFDVSLLQFPGFPLEELANKDVQKDVWQYRMERLAGGDSTHVQPFLSAYLFIDDKVKEIQDIILNQKEHTPDTTDFINAITRGIKKHLSLAKGKHAKELENQFPAIRAAIPRAEIVAGISTGLDAYLHNVEGDKHTDKAELVRQFHLSQEEAETYITTHLDKLPGILKYFPGYDFTELYQKDEIKQKLIVRIPKEPQHADFFYAATREKLTSIERDNICIRNFIDGRAATIQEVETQGKLLRSNLISTSINHLSEMCKDKKNLKKQLNTPEVKGILRKWTRHKISDNSYANEFHSDETIASLCNDTYFPLSPEEVNKEIMNVFLQGCREARIPIWKDRYQCIKQCVAEPTPELIQAGIDGVVNVLDIAKYTHEYAMDHNFINIRCLTNTFPFLTQKWEANLAIQEALATLKRHFLSEGWLGSVKKLDALNADKGRHTRSTE